MKFIHCKIKGMLINEAFRNEYLKKDRLIENPLNNLGMNEDENKKISERKHIDYRVKFVNGFDLMFIIKSINRNEIVVCQNRQILYFGPDPSCPNLSVTKIQGRYLT